MSVINFSTISTQTPHCLCAAFTTKWFNANRSSSLPTPPAVHDMLQYVPRKSFSKFNSHILSVVDILGRDLQCEQAPLAISPAPLTMSKQGFHWDCALPSCH